MNDLKHKILRQVKHDLEEIEVALEQNLNPYLDLVSQIAGHILFSGGKRLRPLLMVLSARICGYKGGYDKIFSTIFEYLHAATLLHDDLVDEATLRRGKPVANAIWGNAAAVLVGSLDLTEAEYMEIIKRKTAVLFQGTCRAGALIADGSLIKETALSDYGFNLGIAFQMVDDLLDYTFDTVTLGKEVGADLKEGKLTLPVIYSLKSADEKDRKRMENIIENKNFSVNDFKTLIRMIDKYGGQSYTQNLAKEYVQNARKALAAFENSKTKEVLLMIADYTLSRNF
jgi:octaprenyl-diphosphate synthase